MPRPPEKYSGLDDASPVCQDRVQPYMRREPATISAPYKGMNAVRISLEAPVSPVGFERGGPFSEVWSLFEALRESFTASPRGFLGWSSRTETHYLNKVRAYTVTIEDAAAALQIGPKPQILSYAQKAQEAFDEIAKIYRRYKFSITLPWVSNPQRRMAFGLDEWEEDLRPWVHPDAGIWDAGRYRAREDIRRLWDRGMSFLWCAMVGMAESEALAKNKIAFDTLQLEAEGVEDVEIPSLDIVPGAIDPGTESTLVPGAVEPIPEADLIPPDLIPPLEATPSEDDDDDADLPDAEDDIPEDVFPDIPDEVPPTTPREKGFAVLAIGAAALALLILKGR